MHDELGDTVRLTEERVMGSLDTLERFTGQYDIGFDYFSPDGFWFDRRRGYRYFNPETLPNGYDPILRRIADVGMLPGLRYWVGEWPVSGPEWADRAVERGLWFSRGPAGCRGYSRRSDLVGRIVGYAPVQY
jgi:hypothetical protein